MGEKLVGERPETKLAESQFLKRIDGHSIKYFASFKRKHLKYKICSNSVAVSDNLKILHISAVFVFGQNQY